MNKFKSILHRYEGNPIFHPADFPYGTADQVFNPGQVMTPDGRTILLLSMVPRGGGGARVHVAESTDGIHFNIRPEPLFSASTSAFPEFDSHPIDCRVTFFPTEDCYYIIRPGNGRDCGPVSLLYRTKDFITTEALGIISLPANRVPCLFPEKINGLYARLDRPYNCGVPYSASMAHIWISRSPDLLHWGEHELVLRRGCTRWSAEKVGPTPPIRTEKGWLEIFHGVQNCFSSWRYSLGAALLDLEHPERVIGLMKSYLLTPETEYECRGVVPDTVFSTGAVVDWNTRTLRIYYGAADTSIALAYGSLDEIIEGCIKGF